MDVRDRSTGCLPHNPNWGWELNLQSRSVPLTGIAEPNQPGPSGSHLIPLTRPPLTKD